MHTGTMTTRAMLAAMLAAALATAACGDDRADDSASASPQASLAAVEAALPAINDAVPEALRERLRFEAKTAEDDELAAAIPVGWQAEHMPGYYKPADGADLGFMTHFSVGSNCDGACAAKDWQAAVDKVEFAQFARDDFTIDRDEKLGDDGRLLIAHNGRSAYVVAAWWKADAARYYYCRASLADDAASAVAAFEQACRSTRVLAW